MVKVVIFAILIAFTEASEEVRDRKLEQLVDAQYVIQVLMNHDLEHGQVFCTNRTNPLAPVVKPFCQDEDKNDLKPVCTLTEKVPDPFTGCPQHGNEINSRFLKIRCPKSANLGDRAICPPGLKPLFVPNVHAKKAEKPLVVCQNDLGEAIEIDKNCHAICADGSEPDTCLGCMDRSDLRCLEQNLQICPEGYKATMFTVPFQCPLPYRYSISIFLTAWSLASRSP